MKNLVLLAAFMGCTQLYAQTVTTFAGVPNDDAANNYESRTSNVDLDDTYFSYPSGVCVDPNGNMFISERNKIRMIADQKVFIRAGSPSGPTFSEGYKNGTGTQSSFRIPAGMVCDANGDIYVVDADNHAIRKVSKYVNVGNPQSVETFAGKNAPGTIPGYGESGSADGTGYAARFNQPQGITIDKNGNLYVADYNNFTIRKITPAGVVTTLAGKAETEGTADASTGSNARFGGPWGVAMLDDNHLVVTDAWNTNIRKVNINTGATSTIAGPTTGPNQQHADGTLANAKFRAPKGVVVIEGIIYVADYNIIRAIDISGDAVTTFAGDKNSYEIKDGTGSEAKFTELDLMYTNGDAVIYACEYSGSAASHVIRKITIDNLVPNADFTANIINPGVNQKTTLTDQSSGATVTSRKWTITGPGATTVHTGDSTTVSMEVSFDTPGFYSVRLDIENDYGTSFRFKDSYLSVSSTGSVSNVEANALLNLYPNPARDVLLIELQPGFRLQHTLMQVYDMHSRLVWEGSYADRIDLSSFENGTYFLSVADQDKKAIKRFVVQH